MEKGPVERNEKSPLLIIIPLTWLTFCENTRLRSFLYLFLNQTKPLPNLQSDNLNISLKLTIWFSVVTKLAKIFLLFLDLFKILDLWKSRQNSNLM